MCSLSFNPVKDFIYVGGGGVWAWFSELGQNYPVKWDSRHCAKIVVKINRLSQAWENQNQVSWGATHMVEISFFFSFFFFTHPKREWSFSMTRLQSDLTAAPALRWKTISFVRSSTRLALWWHSLKWCYTKPFLPCTLLYECFRFKKCISG